jgi:cytochrome oxidase assembly protein ShyY1
MRKPYLLLVTILFAEAALLSLAHWQWQRYHQRLAEQSEAAMRPPMLLQGAYLPFTAALTNQPNPAVPEESGWRVLGLLQTSQSLVVIDRGYARPQFLATQAPDFTQLQPPAPPQTLRGIWVPLPTRKGWLNGPDTTTHPKLLAFLNPARLTSASVLPQQFVLTAPDTSATTPMPNAPPTANPLRHLSYFIQWLVMAAIFPLLVYLGWRRR